MFLNVIDLSAEGPGKNEMTSHTSCDLAHMQVK